MTINSTAGTDARPTMNFLPFDSMTIVQQAEHLVYAHGFDVDYFWLPGVPALAALESNDDVMHAWMNVVLSDDNTDGNSYPSPAGLTHWHNGEHEENPHGGADRCLHTHDK